MGLRRYYESSVLDFRICSYLVLGAAKNSNAYVIDVRSRTSRVRGTQLCFQHWLHIEVGNSLCPATNAWSPYHGRDNAVIRPIAQLPDRARSSYCLVQACFHELTIQLSLGDTVREGRPRAAPPFFSATGYVSYQGKLPPSYREHLQRGD